MRCATILALALLCASCKEDTQRLPRATVKVYMSQPLDRLAEPEVFHGVVRIGLNLDGSISLYTFDGRRIDVSKGVKYIAEWR